MTAHENKLQLVFEQKKGFLRSAFVTVAESYSGEMSTGRTLDETVLRRDNGKKLRVSLSFAQALSGYNEALATGQPFDVTSEGVKKIQASYPHLAKRGN